MSPRFDFSPSSSVTCPHRIGLPQCLHSGSPRVSMFLIGGEGEETTTSDDGCDLFSDCFVADFRKSIVQSKGIDLPDFFAPTNPSVSLL